uniref:EF-hand domain-containing protein n=1 Tax=Panagrolaimus sp. JU765 TaxID=591449 RepID=A0AC34QMM7_9BILA
MWTAIRFRTFRSLRSRESRYDSWLATGRQKYFRASKGLGGNAAERIARMKQSDVERQRNLERQFGPQSFKLKFGNSVVRRLYWAFRRFQFWLCFYDDDVEVDLEDLLTNPFNTQPPSLDELQRLTGFRRDWLMFIYRNFKQHPEGCSLSPTGTNMTAAQFVFSLMMPDNHGRVDEAAFIRYARSIFDLNASLESGSTSGDVTTFGMLHQISASNNSQSMERSGGTSRSGERKHEAPWITNVARKQFHQLDVDKDGFITIDDIQHLFDQKNAYYESLYLKTENERDIEISDHQIQNCAS